MSDVTAPKLTKWPFLLGDACLLAVAAGLIYRSEAPIGVWQIAACVVSVSVGAWILITPFLREYEAAVELAESDGLTDAVAQIQKLETAAAQIGAATGQWQQMQQQSARTVGAAEEIAQRMTAEVRGFADFMQKSNDSEKATLRLEVDKARRAEGEWLQIVTRILDHVYALNQAAARAAQPGLVEQLGQFQNACRDVARRVGLVPLVVPPDALFDEKLHQLVEGAPPGAPGARVAETIATGYSYQGQLLRRSLVTLQGATPAAPNAAAGTSAGEPEAAPAASEPRELF